MSNLAKVICLLLVAVATSVSAELTLAEARQSMGLTVSSLGSYIETEYKRQERRLQEFELKDSAKLIQLKTMEYTKLAEIPLCYEEHKDMCEEVREKLGYVKKRLLKNLEDHKKQGFKCLTRHGAHSAVVACVKEV